MKIRTDFVTNSSSSSFVSLHIENPVLVGILARYRDMFESGGFQFSGDEGGTPTTVEFNDPESFQMQVPSSLQELTDRLIDNLPEDLEFDVDYDEFERIAKELNNTIKQERKSILANYRKVLVESGEGGWDESTDFICDIVDDAIARFGFRQMDDSDPEFEKEVRKWELILTYGDYDPNRRIEAYAFEIKEALRTGDRYALAREYVSSAKFEFQGGDKEGTYTPGGAKREGPDFEEYQGLLKAAGGGDKTEGESDEPPLHPLDRAMLEYERALYNKKELKDIVETYFDDDTSTITLDKVYLEVEAEELEVGTKVHFSVQVDPTRGLRRDENGLIDPSNILVIELQDEQENFLGTCETLNYREFTAYVLAGVQVMKVANLSLKSEDEAEITFSLIE